MAKIFLDTACPTKIQEGFATGLVDGITTNPTLLIQALRHLSGNRGDLFQEYPQEDSYPTPQNCFTAQSVLPTAIPFEGFFRGENQRRWAEFWSQWSDALEPWGFSGALCRFLMYLCSLSSGPFSIEVMGAEEEHMISQGIALAALAPNVVIKVPVTVDGLKACTVLSKKGIPVNVTLCFTPIQGFLAAKAGASYVSPFVGRLDDSAENNSTDKGLGQALIEALSDVLARHQLPCVVLAASLRNPNAVFRALQGGAKAVTIPPPVFFQLYQHPLTIQGFERFESDWGAQRA